MSCLLCLESLLSVGECVNIDSIEGQQLEMKNIIEKNFIWLKLCSVSDEEKGVCKKCWESLMSFYEFYVRVKKAHKSLVSQDVKLFKADNNTGQQSTVSVLEEHADEVHVKIEPDIIGIHRKLRRGRSRCQNLEEINVECDKETTDAKRVEFKIEELYITEENPCALEPKEGTNAPDVLQDVGSVDGDENLSLKPSNKKRMSRRNKGKKVILSDQTKSAKQHESGKSETNEKLPPGEPLEKFKSCKGSDKFIEEHFKLSCSLCNVALANFATLKTHFQSEHQTEGYVMCCGKKMHKRCRLVEHLRGHQNPSLFKCHICDKTLANNHCLKVHIKRHDKTRERKFQCEICLKKFHLRSGYLSHKLLHLPDEQKTIPCPQCDKTFATNYTMNQHLRFLHLKSYGKICDICGKSLIGREALRRHLEEHSGVSQSAAKCEICGITLTSKYALTQHKKMMHIEENRTPQVCPICSKVSPGLRAHKLHMRFTHTMERKHACPMCEKAFKRPKELREHMTTHTGEVLYTCPHCPKTFNSNANMYSHRKKFHPKEWEERRMYRFKKDAPKIGVVNKTSGFVATNKLPEST